MFLGVFPQKVLDTVYEVNTIKSISLQCNTYSYNPLITVLYYNIFIERVTQVLDIISNKSVT